MTLVGRAGQTGVDASPAKTNIGQRRRVFLELARDIIGQSAYLRLLNRQSTLLRSRS
ncbi:hypothetical protein [Methylosinus sp. KRF6]|uniref:hypothetical protein n=1 Tax=Methylosinus sp. KRF6 TaxID=2846853 RepID=UPI001C0BFDE9|nr:hypothetical protein [Methylosinus sp. KRF6]MBU3887992.1 hypothetical protein [Methylosinus sp. KRF6]